MTFFNFQYGFRSSRSTVDLLIELHLIELLGLLNRFGATHAVALDISKAFNSLACWSSRLKSY